MFIWCAYAGFHRCYRNLKYCLAQEKMKLNLGFFGVGT